MRQIPHGAGQVLKCSTYASNTIHKEMTMANWFETITKTLADEKIGRRTALRRVGGTVAGVALAGALPELALAKTNKHCPGGGGNCSIGFVNCSKSSNTNCYCFTDISGKAVCGCNTYCSQAPTCSSDKGCGKGNACISVNGCTGCGSSTGVCIANCAKKKNKNCQLGSGHGTTAAR
jgi:hypothetical protein